MNIFEVAIKAGLSVKTVRYHADIALVPEAERSAAGYRTYDEPALKKLIFAKRTREFGFSISECQELLSLYQDEERTSANVKVIAQRRLEEIIQKQKELESLRKELAHLATLVMGMTVQLAQ